MHAPVPSESLYAAPAGLVERVISDKTWNVEWKVEKWHDEADYLAGKPYDEVAVVRDNGLTNTGITMLLNVLIGGAAATYPPYNAANSLLKVGDSATGFGASQSDLQAATNTATGAMNSTYPSVASQTVSWQATFGSAVANFVWNEVGVQNGGPISATSALLNRKVQNFGTKASGASWTLTLSITIS